MSCSKTTATATKATKATAGKRVTFRMAGYAFTYHKGSGSTRVRIDMWREDPATGERHWITVAACSPNRASARSVALALVAWVKSCDVGPKRDAQAQAVAESFAMLQERIATLNPGSTGSVRTRVAPPRAVRPAAAATAAVTLQGAAGGTRGAAA